MAQKLSAAATLPFLLAIAACDISLSHKSGERENRYVLAISRAALILVLASMPSVGWAQVGRAYVSVEAYVGLARAVHVGRIVELERIDYGKPLTWIEKFGERYQMVFEISETIRGEKTERLELVLALQSTHFLVYMRDHAVELMLVAGPNRIDSFPGAEIGIEEQGKRLDGERFQFRLLTPVDVPKSDGGDSIAPQLNDLYDSSRMFTNEFEVVEGREKILNRARAFAKEHTEMLPAVSIRVPNEFGAVCGFPNAYSLITFSLCPSTRKTLSAIREDPSRVMGRVTLDDEDFERSQMLESIDRALAVVPDGDAK